MKKLIALFVTLMLLCGCAFAEENGFSGKILVGNLPKDATVIRNEENADGYIEELEYDGLATIALCCFSTSHARDAYLDGYSPDDEQILDDGSIVCGMQADHRTFTSGENEDCNVVNAYSFEADEHVYLFLVSVDSDAYEEDGYPEMIQTWLDSLELADQ